MAQNIWEKFDKQYNTEELAREVQEQAQNGGNFTPVPYGTLCVRAYLLKPPVDAKDWINEARKGIERMRRC